MLENGVENEAIDKLEQKIRESKIEIQKLRDLRSGQNENDIRFNARKEATLVYASDTDKVYYDDGSTLKAVGSGSGGGINFVNLSTTWSPDNQDNVDAETSVGNWVSYADAAGTLPVDI